MLCIAAPAARPAQTGVQWESGIQARDANQPDLCGQRRAHQALVDKYAHQTSVDRDTDTKYLVDNYANTRTSVEKYTNTRTFVNKYANTQTLVDNRA